MFSVFDTVLDVVLYEDNPTSSWFTRNGYVVVARDLFYSEDYPLRQRVYATWMQLNDPVPNDVDSDQEESSDCDVCSD
ncbi:hypothetical protein MFLAVUS_000249 [Mucor flavus]|uniref:Uncharacterized protein n=1 Tax=Mucor flavus TaxID=439312 RepID=A0ABP9YJ65_9FUNG